MSPDNEIFDTFRRDADNLLKELLPSQELKQSVLNKIHKEQRMLDKNRLKIFTASSAACMLVIIGLLQSPTVYAQVSPAFSKITSWIQEVTHIPVKIPVLWKSAAEEGKGALPGAANGDEKAPVVNNDDRRYVYFEVTRSNDAYSITAYKVKVPIAINDKAALLEKNGPVSQADVLGSIEGEKITDKTNENDTAFIAPADKNEFEIIPKVAAFKDITGCTVWWEQGSWQFNYTGPSSGIENHLKRLAAEWSKISSSTAALKGQISMVEGNKFHAFITWEQNGIRYTYSVPNSNWSDVIEVINSFTEINWDRGTGSLSERHEVR